MDGTRPTAIYGGAFDPPHYGHAEVVRQLLCAESGIDSVVVMPSRRPPHKTPVAAYEHRIAMCELLFCGGEAARVSIFQEADVSGATFTADVVHALPGWGSRNYLLVLGVDEVVALGSWKTPDRIFKHADLLVIERPGFMGFDRQAVASALSVLPVVKEKILRARSIKVDTAFTLSSTDIRSSLAIDWGYAKYLLTRDVRTYIREHGLYGAPRED